MKWLPALLAKVESFPDESIKAQEPTTKVADGEKVLGVVPEGVRKYIAYYGAQVDRIREMRKAHLMEHMGPNHTLEMCKKFRAAISLIKEENEVVAKAFWRDIRNEFKAENCNLGVRKGWKVVEKPEKEESGIEIISVEVGSLADLLNLGG